MLVLNTFGPAFGFADSSPFCTKAMYLLSMSGVEWKNNPGFDSRKAPMGKLPVLVDDGVVVADSEAIRIHLEGKYGADFDAGLTDAQRITARALIRMADEHLYFCLLYDRWKVDANWASIKQLFFSELPRPLRMIVPSLVRRSVVASLDGQGMGRFDYAQMLTRADQDLAIIEKALASNGPFLFGDVPVAADASVVSVVAAIAASPAETDLRARVRSSKLLMDYSAAYRAKFPALEVA